MNTLHRVGKLDSDLSQSIDWINSWQGPIAVVVPAPGASVSVPHILERIPEFVVQVATTATTGTGSVYPGLAPWTATTVSLTASAAGTYHVLLRR